MTTGLRVIVFFIFCLTFFNCQQTAKKDDFIRGEFFGITPDSEPQLLAPNFINTRLNEYNGTFSPKGDEFYYTTEYNNIGYITYTKMNSDKTWSDPKVAIFSGNYSDYDPMFSPDGSRIYFSSTRPPSEKSGSSIWYVEKDNNNKWSTPEQLDFTSKNEYYSSATENGVIYFNIWSTLNIFKAIPSKDSYNIVELDTIINGNFEKGDPFIAPTEDYIIFRAVRNDGLGRGDLYISFFENKNKIWSKPINLGSPINSSGQEMCPYVTADGKTFVFSSSRTESLKIQPENDVKSLLNTSNTIKNGKMNIYCISTEFIERLRPNKKE